MLAMNPFPHSYQWCDRDVHRRIVRLLNAVAKLDILRVYTYCVPYEAVESNLLVDVTINTLSSKKIVVQMSYMEGRSNYKVVETHLATQVGFDVYPNRHGKSKKDAAADTQLIDLALSVVESHIDEIIKTSTGMKSIRCRADTIARENAARVKLVERLDRTRVLADYKDKNRGEVKAGTPRTHALFNTEIDHEDE